MSFLIEQCTFYELTEDIFYEKNGFCPLFPTEEQESVYTMGKKDIPVKLDTRLMYFDLLKLRG